MGGTRCANEQRSEPQAGRLRLASKPSTGRRTITACACLPPPQMRMRHAPDHVTPRLRPYRQSLARFFRATCHGRSTGAPQNSNHRARTCVAAAWPAFQLPEGRGLTNWSQASVHEAGSVPPGWQIRRVYRAVALHKHHRHLAIDGTLRRH